MVFKEIANAFLPGLFETCLSRDQTVLVWYIMPNTHRRRRRDSTVELSRVGGVYAPVVSRDPVSNFLRQS